MSGSEDARNTGKALPSTDRLNEVLNYDRTTGLFTWRTNRRGRGAREGLPAGTMKPDGYVSIMVDRKRYPAHRLAWKIVVGSDPNGVIDHMDGNRSNNVVSNLRVADLKQNAHNACISRANKTGYKGVTLFARTGRYRAGITKDGVFTDLGYFATAEEADVAVRAARAELHGEFTCHGEREAA